ncbi:MAG: hypothetical protein LUM44_16965 [Pyrinomonadaceae bacterium]|nr:hypothetical protein [Pyrinomonadaceae bacterium]
MNENVTVVFHGFLNLTNLEKLKLTEKINEYLDSMNREPLREKAEAEFEQIKPGEKGKVCKCCGR